MRDNKVERTFYQKPENWVSEEDRSGNLVGAQEDAGKSEGSSIQQFREGILSTRPPIESTGMCMCIKYRALPFLKYIKPASRRSLTGRTYVALRGEPNRACICSATSRHSPAILSSRTRWTRCWTQRKCENLSNLVDENTRDGISFVDINFSFCYTSGHES